MSNRPILMAIRDQLRDALILSKSMMDGGSGAMKHELKNPIRYPDTDHDDRPLRFIVSNLTEAGFFGVKLNVTTEGIVTSITHYPQLEEQFRLLARIETYIANTP